MGLEKGSSFHGARLVDADFSEARLHSPVLEGAKVTDGYFVNADFSGDIEGLRVNGVEIEPLVEAERVRRFPDRAKLRAADPQELSAAWSMIERLWNATLARARSLPEPLLYRRVDEEWSFVETLRHLIFATDIWLLRMIRHEGHPFHPWGIGGSWLTDPRAIGLEADAEPSFVDVLQVRQGRMKAVGETIAAVTPGELKRMCMPPEPSGHPAQPHTVLHCLRVVLNEEWEHNQYANRDLAVLAASGNEESG